MAGCIFPGILALIFILNVFIRFPFQKAINISESGMTCLESPGKSWFILEQDSYTVEEEFNTISIRNSNLFAPSRQYTYFNITVFSDGEYFSMPVRVTAKKAASLSRGDSVALYGMASKTHNKLSQEQLDALDEQPNSISVCLNDNGDTVVSRMLSAGVFILLSAVCIWLTIKIYRFKP